MWIAAASASAVESKGELAMRLATNRGMFR
jgi:hypothetical protein